jgi:hypothetical protein
MPIREATPRDALEVARVHVRAWQVGYRGLLPEAYLDGLRAEDRAARYTFGDADQRSPATMVVIDEGAIRGFATTGPARAGGAEAGELLALYVDPDFWGPRLRAHARRGRTREAGPAGVRARVALGPGRKRARPALLSGGPLVARRRTANGDDPGDRRRRSSIPTGPALMPAPCARGQCARRADDTPGAPRFSRALIDRRLRPEAGRP